jgi:hypothetical protein
VREETKRSTNAEGPASPEETTSTKRAVIGLWWTTVTMTTEMGLPKWGVTRERRTTPVTPKPALGAPVPPMKCRMHFSLRLVGAISLPTGFHAWAPRLTRLFST